MYLPGKSGSFFLFQLLPIYNSLSSIGDEKIESILRSKGLGENTPAMMSETTMHPATRRLVAVTPTDAAATARMFDTLLGDDLPARKAFIALHGKEYVKDADLE